MSKPTLENPQTDEQLKDIVITIASVTYNDEGTPYAVTRNYCGDLEGSIEDFIAEIEEIEQLVHLDKMKADVE